MKLILEENFDVENVVELNESTGEKKYVIKGTFSTPEKKNRNGRIYGRKLWEDNVARYQNEIKNKTINTLMEKEHPPRTAVNPWEAVAQIRKLEMRDGVVYGEAELFNVPETKIMRELIDKGIKIGVSSRGVGKMKGDIVEEFNLITYDIVSTPSDYNANLEGFNESLILEGVEIEIGENGEYICTPEGCKLAESKHSEESDETDDLKSDEEGVPTADEINKKGKKLKPQEPKTECEKKAKELAEALKSLAGETPEEDIKEKELREKFKQYMGREKPFEKIEESTEEVKEGMSVNTKAICDEAKKLSPANQAKVFAYVLSLQD